MTDVETNVSTFQGITQKKIFPNCANFSAFEIAVLLLLLFLLFTFVAVAAKYRRSTFFWVIT